MPTGIYKRKKPWNNGRLGMHHTQETKDKISETRLKTESKRVASLIPWNKGITGYYQKPHYSERGKEHSPETQFQKGSKPWNNGIPHSEETIQKIKNKNPKGETHFNYTGGHIASKRRSLEKRSDFSYIPLNDWFEGCEGHHIDKIHVIHIPAETHQRVYHSLTKNINMDLINSIAWAEYYIQNRGVIK